MQLPTEDEIRARAEADGLIGPGADLPSRLRKTVAGQILADRQRPEAPQTPTGNTLMSRYRHEVEGGTIVVDVVFIPNPPKKE